MLDGELDSAKIAETVNHLAECETCMSVFKSFQALQENLEAEVVPPPVPSGVWENIRGEKHENRKPLIIPFRSRTFKIISVAAALFICFALGYYLRVPVLPVVDHDAPIVLASDRGLMNEERFLHLTRELLSADPVYHRKMYYILHTLNTDSWESNYDPPEIEDTRQSPMTISSDNGDEPQVYKY